MTVKDPKSAAGVRDIHIPEHALKGIKAHLRSNVTGRNGLLFPSNTGNYLAPATFDGGGTRRVKGKRMKVNSAGGWYAARAAQSRMRMLAARWSDLAASGDW